MNAYYFLEAEKKKTLKRLPGNISKEEILSNNLDNHSIILFLPTWNYYSLVVQDYS